MWDNLCKKWIVTNWESWIMGLVHFKGERSVLVKKGIKILWCNWNNYGSIIYHDDKKKLRQGKYRNKDKITNV